MYSIAFLTLALSTGSSARNASGTSPSSQYGTRSQPSAVPPNQALFFDVRPEFVKVPAQALGLDAQLVLQPPAGLMLPRGNGSNAEARNAGSAGLGFFLPERPHAGAA